MTSNVVLLFHTDLFWSELEGRSGSIQAGLSLEFPNLYQSAIDILPEGPNGLLANLDLVNTVVRLAEAHSVVTRVNSQVRHVKSSFPI